MSLFVLYVPFDNFILFFTLSSNNLNEIERFYFLIFIKVYLHMVCIQRK